jgi:leucyl-tRNA synthetase
MEYKFNEIEKKWQDHWKATNAYKVTNDTTKPKCYVLDMFPYPSGSGLHVGHPLGYIASDIYSRYKRLKGFNVLHPMGYDAFGLPAEQYAIEHGVHPAVSTANNIENFRKQLDNIGFSYDWDRAVNTSEPQYYKWTQWIFLELFNSFYNKEKNKAESIEVLIKEFESNGNIKYPMPNIQFSSEEWKTFEDAQQREILMNYRLAFCGVGEVNWCEALGTVLANDEVVNGVSERGGHPVEKKKLRQWYLRITAYADRLLEGLQTVDFSDAMKEMQSNWIGRSEGANIKFEIKNSKLELEVYTTRPDTIFGVDFMVIAPELDWIKDITTDEQKDAVENYLTYVKSRSDIERMAEKKITGCFTGAYALNPFNKKEIPIYISEYVLAGYGTGAIMAVPCGDERDFKFAKHFDIAITNIIGDAFNGEEANPTKDAPFTNSDFVNGMKYKEASAAVINKLEEMGVGTRKINYRMRDAAFSRQRYWGEPFPIVWDGETAYDLPQEILPLELPYLDEIKPGENAQGPLANLPSWTKDYEKYFKNSATKNPPLEGREVGGTLETSTMPGYAGSSWYFLRYMDPHNNETFCDKKISDYWNQVDVYVGGTEHAVGHLLYSRMWTNFLYDKGYISFNEPFKKLLNQGMITGISEKIVRKGINNENEITSSSYLIINWIPKGFSSNDLPPVIDFNEGKKDFKTYLLNFSAELEKIIDGSPSVNVPIEFTENSSLNIIKYLENKQKLENIIEIFVCKDGYYDSELKQWFDFKKQPINALEFKTIAMVEKMSKSKRNVVNPDEIITKYGADTFRMYEMFLGPVEMSKPWDTKGIEGVHRFIKKLWRLFYDDIKGKVWNEEKAFDAELKVLHKTIKKIEEDTEKFSYNTAVSAFMICVNELTDLKCHKKEILAPLLVLLHPYAPHFTAELYDQLYPGSKVLPFGEGENGAAAFPKFDASLLVESSKEYPISINGKMRTTMNFSVDAAQSDIEKNVLENEIVQKWLEGKAPKKIIFVKNKMVNVVV